MEKAHIDNKILYKLGGYGAIYGALIYLVSIIIFLIVLDYPNISNATEKVEMLVNNRTLIIVMHWLAYIIFGLVLIVLSLALHTKIRKNNNITIINIATLIAIIWATLLIASGLIFNHGVAVISELYSHDPQQAVILWQSVEIISSALSFVDGEILGGLWVLLIGISALNANMFGRKFTIYSIVIGIIGIVSIFPFLHVGTALFGIGQIIWFVWISVYLLSTNIND
ncbi:hypothetical protein [Liberiplasma polymorphum]|uniref:hypothetical protein n=1 Tax=Liberiplasma polymorphum TaxID=3374570 RepID=UPI00377694E1